ncbi:DUF4179 domain-containing protein [Bacillus mangrovi]|uniref:DUF4179 domain-containing protein n=1 Tax=Metabacillus mangrovi TaxID=1491830 RepID=A0A7X2V5E5_9BACI|nr:DUF4179 domain-containing protein [Metabacillus mangrovi]MTH54089.1 DUF4179 domain-containing protein [Metabacillus mangrovi]
MKNNFDQEFHQLMTENKEIPARVRKSIDGSYDYIRMASKKKKKASIWKKTAAAACALMATGMFLSNEQVMAGITDFFAFGDQGIKQALQNGFAQEDHHAVANQGVVITLDKHFSDANKVGLRFELAFDDPSLLKNATEVTLDYRLKNGDGEYVIESIPDTKPLKGEQKVLSGAEEANPVLDSESGIAQYEVLMSSNAGNLPELKGAVIEVESVNVFSSSGKLKKAEGNWDLAVANTKQTKPKTIHFAMKNPSSVIQVTKAAANPTSLNLIFSVDGIHENENAFANQMKIVDEKGIEYAASSFSMSEEKNKTIISTNFPITSYNSSKQLKLVINGIGKVELVKE